MKKLQMTPCITTLTHHVLYAWQTNLFDNNAQRPFDEVKTFLMRRCPIDRGHTLPRVILDICAMTARSKQSSYSQTDFRKKHNWPVLRTNI